MHPIKIKAILCTLIFSWSCIFLGCGSDNGSGVSASHKNQKPATDKKAQVMELIIKNSPEQKANKNNSLPRGTGPQALEVTPPDKTGQIGFSPQEIEAARRAFQQVDPKTIEVIPPGKPGEHGLTQAQVDKLIPGKNTKEINPKTIEVIPPSKPGESGLTRSQIEEMTPAQNAQTMNPKSYEVIPPDKSGGQGVTEQELSAIRSSQKQSSVEPLTLPPVPPTPKSQ